MEDLTQSVRLDSFEGNARYQPTAYVDPDTLSEYRVRENAQMIYEASRKLVSPLTGRAYDSVSSDQALYFARELEFRTNRILEDVYKSLSSETLIPTDSSVPAGAKTYTITREGHQGEMVWFDGNASLRGQNRVEREEMSFKVHAAVTQIQINFFDELNARFSGYNLEGKLRKGAERVAREFRNTVALVGDEARGVPGAFTAPYAPKTTSAVVFGPGGATPTAQLAELHRLANLMGEATTDVFHPTAFGVPIKYLNYWRNTILDTANASNRSILEAFVQDNDYINDVFKVHETQGAGPSGEDIILGLRPGDADSMHLEVPQGLTWMPLERSGFNMSMDAYMLIGGINQWRPSNNLIVYATYA